MASVRGIGVAAVCAVFLLAACRQGEIAPAPALVRGPQVALPSQNSIVIAWRSNVAVAGAVEYGETPALGSTVAGPALLPRENPYGEAVGRDVLGRCQQHEQGVLMPQGHCTLFAVGAAEAVAITEDDHYFVCMPFFHANGLFMQVWACLVAGASVTAVKRFSVLSSRKRARPPWVSGTSSTGNTSRKPSACSPGKEMFP